jgi:chromate reductase, NAD(P)H dehydrogenase (quinone)
MKNILILAGTSHRESINLALATHAGQQLENAELTILDLNDFEMPLYSQDLEEASGIPQHAKDFLAKIQGSDGIILSLAEHNGSYATAFKNVLDWTTRVETKLWSSKPMLLMATSPGGRGGANVLGAAEGYFPHLGANVVATFSLPSYFDHFSIENGISDPAAKASFESALQSFKNALS